MARPLRIQFPGACYHVTCRGNERKDIFRDDTDRETFLGILSQSKDIYGIDLYGYVLMNNHFHLLIGTPLGNLSEFMRHFNITYTGLYNRRHDRVGHLYQGRYHSILVDKDEYLSILSRYIHLNPVRTGTMKGRTVGERMEYLRGYVWSSLPGYIEEGKRQEMVDYELILGEYGGDNPKGRKGYRERIPEDISSGLEIRDKIVGQSILGTKAFIERVRERFLEKKEEREHPAVRELKRYGSKEKILRAIEEVMGRTIEEIKGSKGTDRKIVMELLYRRGGVKGREIGELLGVDYSTVSQGRKRLRETMVRDHKVRRRVEEIEARLSQ